MTIATNTLTKTWWSVHKILTGAPVAAETATHSAWNRRNVLAASGFETIMFAPWFTGGAGPTCTIEVYFYDEDLNDFALVSTIATIPNGKMNEITVNDQKVYLRVSAIGSNPTELTLRATGGKRSRAGA